MTSITKKWRIYLLLCTLIHSANLFAQLEVTFTTGMNTNCDGSECNYEGPGILINEIMMSPFTGDGSLWGGTAGQGGEWIELYNPNFCEPVDVSCYYLGNNSTDIVGFESFPFPAGFVIPFGTVLPPAGFLVIRGPASPAVSPDLLVENGGNTLEIVVDGTGVCLGGGSRIWFPNAGGWFAFYDPLGVPQDAVTWGNENNLSFFPCVPTLEGCISVSELESYWTIPDDRKGNILNTSAADFPGQSLRRIPDGGEWSVPSNPTMGTCNDVCIDPEISTCNGTATAVVTGGSGEYFYQWNDAQGQTSATAVDLCAQEYCVLITDSEGNELEACVELESPVYDLTGAAVICDGDDYLLPDGTTTSEAGEYFSMLTTAGGCDSAITTTIEVAPVYEFEINSSICESAEYVLPDGEVVNQAGTYLVEFETTAGCDSVYSVNLSVDPFITISSGFVYCEGEVHVFPDGTTTSISGDYTIQVPGANCDTLFDQSVVFMPDYHTIAFAEICAGETFELPDGTSIQESGTYFSELNSVSGCDSIIETHVVVHELPLTSIDMDDLYCYQPGMVEVEVFPDGGTFSLGSSAIDLNSEWLNLLPPGTFVAQYSYTNDQGCSNVVQNQFTVLPPLSPEFAANHGCFNTIELMNLSNDESGLNWQWQVNDSVFSESFSAEYEYEYSGTYEISLTVIDSGQCSYSYSQLVEVETGLQLSDFWLPDIITPNGDASNQYFVLMPEDDHCLQYSLTIFNRWGKKIFETTESGAPFSGIDQNGNSVEEGVYFYFLESAQIDCNDSRYENLCKGSLHIFR